MGDAFLLAQVSKIGIPVPTTVAADVLSTACELSASIASVPLLIPGAPQKGSVKIGSAAFFRVTISVTACRSGVYYWPLPPKDATTSSASSCVCRVAAMACW